MDWLGHCTRPVIGCVTVIGRLQHDRDWLGTVLDL